MEITMIHVSETTFTSKPDCSNRLLKEEKVYDLLDSLGISYEGIDHEPANTIEDCEVIDEKLHLKEKMCKNLFLRNRQKTDFYLLLITGDKKFVTKEFSAQLGISRVSFAEPEFMEEYLDVTPGSATVLSLMNDLDHNVTLVIDEDVLKGEYIGCHPCINTSSLKLLTSDITEKFLKHTGHSIHTVNL